MNNCNFSNNQGGYEGGGIYSSGNDLTVNNSVFAQNSAGDYGQTLMLEPTWC